MISWLLLYLKQRAFVLSAQNGMVTNGSGMAPTDEGLIAILVSALLGAFAGLLGGFMASHVFRYLTYLTGRNLGGYSWVIIGAIAGALICGIMAAQKDEG